MTYALESSAVIVTGAASGIGGAVAARLANQGATVIAIDRDEVSTGSNVLPVIGDLSQQQRRNELIAQISHAARGLDVPLRGLVNSAGLSGQVAEYSRRDDADERAVFEVNYFGLGELCRAVIGLFDGAGSIVNLASVDGLRARPRMAHYAASKHAVVGLTRSLARELGNQEIRVNAVAPGPVDTRMMQYIETMEPDETGSYREDLTARIPLGRYGTPGEIATVICFLLSDDASFVTGATWTVDGGLTA